MIYDNKIKKERIDIKVIYRNKASICLLANAFFVLPGLNMITFLRQRGLSYV